MTPSGLPQETPELDAQPGFATPGHHLASGDLWPLVDAAVADEQEGNRIRRDPAIHRPGRWRLDGKPAVDEAENLFGPASQADLIAGRNASYVVPINKKGPALSGTVHDLAGEQAADRPRFVYRPRNVVAMDHHLTNPDPDQGAEA